MSVSLGEAISLGQTGRITPDKVAPSFIHGADQAMRMDFAKARAEEKGKLERQKQIDALAGKLELHGGYNSHYVDAATKAGATAAYDYGNALKSGDVSGAMQIKRLYDEESANRLAQNNELNNFLKTDDGHIIPDEMRKALSLPQAQGLPIMKQLIEQHPVWKEFADVNPNGSYKFAHKKEIDLEGESEAKMASYRPLMNENVGDAVPYGKGSNRYRQQVRLPDEEIAKIATDVAADKSRAAQEIYKDEKGFNEKLKEARAHLGMNGVLSPEVMADKEAEAKRLAVVALVADRLNGKNKHFIDIQREKVVAGSGYNAKQSQTSNSEVSATAAQSNPEVKTILANRLQETLKAQHGGQFYTARTLNKIKSKDDGSDPVITGGDQIDLAELVANPKMKVFDSQSKKEITAEQFLAQTGYGKMIADAINTSKIHAGSVSLPKGKEATLDGIKMPTNLLNYYRIEDSKGNVEHHLIKDAKLRYAQLAQGANPEIISSTPVTSRINDNATLHSSLDAILKASEKRKVGESMEDFLNRVALGEVKKTKKVKIKY